MARIYRSVNANIVGGSGSIPYSSTFNATTSWSLSGGEYLYSIPETTHGKGTSPMVQVFELIGSDYFEIQTAIKIETNGDITIIVNETPDLRFQGKVTIQGE